MAYWFNINTRQVESDEDKSPSDDLMGPYATEAEAAQALQTAAAKTEAWDEEDRAWEGEEA